MKCMCEEEKGVKISSMYQILYNSIISPSNELYD